MIQNGKDEWSPAGELYMVSADAVALIDGDKLKAWFRITETHPGNWQVAHYYTC